METKIVEKCVQEIVTPATSIWNSSKHLSFLGSISYFLLFESPELPEKSEFNICIINYMNSPNLEKSRLELNRQ